MKVFFVSLSGCMVSIVSCYSVIVLEGRRGWDLEGFEKRCFRRVGGCAV